MERFVMKPFKLLRVLRSPHSERFLLKDERGDFAALDLHYLTSGKVDGTLIIFDGAGASEADVPAILSQVDEELLPHVGERHENLSFTVVIGRVLGAFTAAAGGEVRVAGTGLSSTT
jgi:hypothetical protein